MENVTVTNRIQSQFCFYKMYVGKEKKLERKKLRCTGYLWVVVISGDWHSKSKQKTAMFSQCCFYESILRICYALPLDEISQSFHIFLW